MKSLGTDKLSRVPAIGCPSYTFSSLRTLDTSAGCTNALCVSLLFCLVCFLSKRWFLKAWLRFTLPVPVRLNLFLAPECVFTLGIIKMYTLYFLVGMMIKIIRLPSILGSCSGLPYSSSACENFSNNNLPRSLNIIDLPEKCM